MLIAIAIAEKILEFPRIAKNWCKAKFFTHCIQNGPCFWDWVPPYRNLNDFLGPWWIPLDSQDPSLTSHDPHRPHMTSHWPSMISHGFFNFSPFFSCQNFTPRDAYKKSTEYEYRQLEARLIENLKVWRTDLSQLRREDDIFWKPSRIVKTRATLQKKTA